MIMTIAALLFILIYGVFFAAHLKKRDTRPISISHIFAFLTRVYVDELLKLIDPLEDEYARHGRSKAEFLQVQTLRLLQACQYLKRIVANAKVLEHFAFRHLRSDDPTKKVLARMVINQVAHVKMWGRAGLFTLFLLRWVVVWIPVRLPILRHFVKETLAAYADLKEVTLMFARHSEPGVEASVAARL